MGLRDEARELAEQRSVIGTSCTVGKIMADMSDEERDDLIEALNDVTLPATLIAEVMQRNGIEVSDKTLQRHRSSRCRRCLFPMSEGVRYG